LIKEQNKCGAIYILTNPSFPQYVKIGYADDVKKRIDQLNRSEATPFAFRLYAFYMVKDRLADKHVHSILDNLNSQLRSKDNINGKKRVREFFAIPPSEAYNLLMQIATISSTEDNLILVNKAEEETKNRSTDKKKINRISKPSLPQLIKCGVVKIGDVLSQKDHDSEAAKVLDEEGNVSFNGTKLSYNSWANKVHGPGNFNFYTYVYRNYSSQPLSEERENFMADHQPQENKDGFQPLFENNSANISSVSISGKTYDANSYSAVLKIVSYEVYLTHPKEIAEISMSKNKYHFSNTKDRMHRPYKLADNLYIEVNLSRHNIIRICKLLICDFGIKDFKVK
jgi:hypothetical protein